MTTSPTASTANSQNEFGRLVLKDANRSRYVSSGFWSRVDLHGLKMDLAGYNSDSSAEDQHQSVPSTQELDRTPPERHGFLFRHNLASSPSDAHEFHPLPSQVPFLLNTYSENVNFFMQVVHMPTITNTIRKSRGSSSSKLAPSDEALLFSIYYAAIISMEDEDVITNFGTTKGELSLKYRLGLEHALAKADFLNHPNLTLVQALDIFLALARRHDSPRFVWMMTGLAIRMAQSLGLHRDGSHFPQLTPYEVEIRRRVWWALCFLDVRSSEDQGMDYTIVSGSFDTKFPLNLDDADFHTETRDTPPERQGLTAILLVAAIEVAEWNHALNAEQEARQWRWIYQTYTHWHAIVILLIEIARRPLSPTVERAWLALGSSWLIPSRGKNWDKKLQIWVPLRNLMTQVRKHRDAEIERLQGSAEAIKQTAAEDENITAPASSCPFMSQEELQEHWRSLLIIHKYSEQMQASATNCMGNSTDMASVTHGSGMSSQRSFSSLPAYGQKSECFRTSVMESQSTEVGQVFEQGDMNVNSETDWQDWLASARNMELNSDMIQ
ncbi:hypothetical protein N0V93_002819 [Gnomoniopsis smithogilvyi]|uniref:Xylanolytic transcriptional activator regulatory domain-containing protein n=1 Tax=Gnomoniopsis smithogilvyi TaxID=1191159 RepID=A0A9W8YXA3_9PEZI|nr:hypothetical protein N0V93_002819 [Gnomoniopsis smithogilvyi]